MAIDSSANQSPASRKRTIRLLVEIPGEGWRPWGSTLRGLNVPKKLQLLPQFSGKTVRVAFANVRLVQGRPVELRNVFIETWMIGEDGYADLDDQVKHGAQRIKNEVLNMPMCNATDGDIDAIRLCLDLRTI